MSIEVDFSDVVRREGPVRVARVALAPGERDYAVSTWRQRMAGEYVSSRVFSTLSSQAMRAGLSHGVVCELARMAMEEIDHGRRCARVVAAFDALPTATIPDLPPVPEHDDVAPLEAFFRNVLSVSCCSETAAVALVGAEREVAATEELREQLDRILADEVGHARIGWKLLDEASLAQPMRARLSGWLVTCFLHQLRFHGGSLAMPSVSEASLSVGVPDGPRNFELFFATMQTVTVPQLERRGFQADRAFDLAMQVVKTEKRS